MQLGERFLLVQAEDIIYASLADDSINIVTGQVSGAVSFRTLDELQARLDPAVFWRVHRSHLVNINKIKEIVPWFSRNFILQDEGREGARRSRQPVADPPAPGVSEALGAEPAEPAALPAEPPCPPMRRRRSVPVAAYAGARSGRHAHVARPRGAGGLAQDAAVGRRLRHADRDLRLPGGARRGPEHGADAGRSGSADRQQVRLSPRPIRAAATS